MDGADGIKLVGLRRAALLMQNLDRATLAKVLKHLNSNEVSRLMRYYEREFSGGRPSEDELRTVVRDFLQHRAGPAPAEYFREALEIAFGANAADQLLRHNRFRSIAEKVDPPTLARSLVGEHPQAVALVLSRLPPRYAADVLNTLPEELRAGVIERISRGINTTETALDALLNAVEENLASRNPGGGLQDKQGGIQRVAAVLNQMESEAAAEIVGRIRESDPERAAAIEQEMFHFDDVLQLDPLALQRVLTEVKPDRLAMALKGIPEEKRQVVYKALPESQIQTLKEELDALGRVPVREANTARREIANLALLMDREGKIHVRINEDLVS
jgi:flagellar motor switch protein FliG